MNSLGRNVYFRPLVETNEVPEDVLTMMLAFVNRAEQSYVYVGNI